MNKMIFHSFNYSLSFNYSVSLVTPILSHPTELTEELRSRQFFFPLRFAKLFDLLIEPTRIIVGQGLASGYRLVPPRLLLFHLEAQD